MKDKMNHDCPFEVVSTYIHYCNAVMFTVRYYVTARSNLNRAIEYHQTCVGRRGASFTRRTQPAWQPGSQSPSPTRQTVGQVIGCINVSCRRRCPQDGYGFFCIKFQYVDLSTQNQYQYVSVLQSSTSSPM